MRKIIIALFLIFAHTVSARDTTNFNTNWEFKKGPFVKNHAVYNTDFRSSQWSKIEVPHTWNNRDMQIDRANASAFRNPQDRFYTGECLYKKTYTPSKNDINKRTFLKFEGVGSIATIYVNNAFAGRHKGAYSAFVIEITSLLKYDEPNEILIVADNEMREDVIPTNNVLFGVYGGIYRDVELIKTNQINIAVDDYASPGVFISQKDITKSNAKISIKTKIDNKTGTQSPVTLITTIYEMGTNKIKVQKKEKITLPTQGRTSNEQDIEIKNPHLWQGLEDPYLYRLSVGIEQDGKIIDEVVQPLGLRHFELKANDGMFLNGKKVPMYGVCRHQDWWEEGSALKKEHHDIDLDIIKEIGATTIRLAHYQQAEYIYAKCDSIGLIVWAEIPFVNRVTTYEADNAKQQLTELIRQNYNHPSIYIWGLHNEVYTPFTQTIPLTTQLNDLAKTEDPYRYTASVSGYNKIDATANNNADIQGINHYFGWYGGKISDIKPWIEKVEKEFPNHKVIFAEYGGEANIEQQKEDIGEIGNCCGYDKKYYETFGTKFHEIQWGVISQHPYLLASYIWNTFDFATPMSAQGGVIARNMKGLVTFDRKTKKDPFYWYKANWSKEPVLYITQRRANDRENKVTPITVYSNRGIPTLFVNEKEITTYHKGTTDVHYIFDDISLQEGENIIVAQIGKDLTDEIIWYYSSEAKKSDNTDPTERKGEHIGL